jgi:SAM-dependent methyltransferase
MDLNQQVFDSVASRYTDMALMPAERAVLRRLGTRLSEMDMLDLGVGTGRTGWTFAPLVRRYVGVDYAPRMIELARGRLGDDPNVELLVGDARDLSPVTGEFDFVLFSFNAIDAVSAEERLAVLDQVRAKTRPGGRFLFSTHSLRTLPFPWRRAPSERFGRSRLYQLYSTAQAPRYAYKINQINRRLNLQAARERGWTMVPSMAHGFRIRDHYIDPEFQIRQLAEHGFEVEAVFDTAGNEVTLPHPSRDPWFDYLCVPV